jgi:hypothetical protein
VVTEDVEGTASEICASFGLQVAFRDPALEAYGMRNAILPVADAFIEVAGPTRDDVPAARYLERHGPGGYVVLLQTDDLPAAERRLEAARVGVTHRIEHDGAIELHLRFGDVGGTLLSVDHVNPPDAWPFAGPDWREQVCTEQVSALAGIDIACGDTDAVAHRWGDVVGLRAHASENGWELRLDDADVRFVEASDGRDRLTRIRLRASGSASRGSELRIGSLTLTAV